MSKYYVPIFGERQFHCPLCFVYAKQTWGRLIYQENQALSPIHYSLCSHCEKNSYWYQEKLILPKESGIPYCHKDMPSSCIDIYNEARGLADVSARAAAALIRLLIQELMVELGRSGKNLNDDISVLVKNGLPKEVQQALDYCRVVGNNAVHPGEINISDNADIVSSLFEMVNFIVEDRISRQKKISSLYEALPLNIKKSILNRDEGKS